MKEEVEFSAPWGRSLKFVTGLCVIICGGIAIHGLRTNPQDGGAILRSSFVLPLLILAVSVFFMIRGYVLMEESLIVKRLGWNSRVELSGLRSVEMDSQAMGGSIKIFGTGGLFCFAGKFWNKKLGSYRASATAPKKSVVLKFEKRVIVVTPGNPEEFTAAIKSLQKMQDVRQYVHGAGAADP